MFYSHSRIFSRWSHCKLLFHFSHSFLLLSHCTPSTISEPYFLNQYICDYSHFIYIWIKGVISLSSSTPPLHAPYSMLAYIFPKAMTTPTNFIILSELYLYQPTFYSTSVHSLLSLRCAPPRPPTLIFISLSLSPFNNTTLRKVLSICRQFLGRS